MKAMMMRSVQPRTKPVSTPIAVPAVIESSTVRKLIHTLLEAPAIEAREFVAAELVGAQPKAALGGFRRARKLIAERLVRRPEESQHGRREDQAHDEEAYQGLRVRNFFIPRAPGIEEG